MANLFGQTKIRKEERAMRRGRFLKGCVVFGICFLMFCIHAMAAEKVLKIGVQAPFTGPTAKGGEDMRAAAMMAMEKINYTVGDYKIELVWIDCQSDPAKGASAYAEAVERKGIQAGVINYHSSVAVALMDVCAHYKIHHAFSMGGTAVVNEKWRSNPEKYNYWGPKFWPDPATLVGGYSQCLNNAIEKGIFKPRNKLVAIYGEDTDWGRSEGKAFEKDFTNTGWKVVAQDYFLSTQTDFYQQMSKYKKAEVAVIAGTSSNVAAMSAFIKQAQEVGVKAVIIADGLGWIGDWYTVTGSASDYVLDMIPQLTTKQSKEWAEAIESRFKIKPSAAIAGISYDATNFFIKVLRHTLEKYGKLDKETIHNAFVEDVNTGKLTFTEKDGAIIMKEYRFNQQTMPDPVVGPGAYFFPVIQYKGGKADIVYPADWAVRAFEQPK